MKKKLIICVVVVLIILADVAIFFYYFKKPNKTAIPETKISAKEIAAEVTPIKEYNFQTVIYNFWGKVVSKDDGGILVEGIIPKTSPSDKETNQTTKFKVSSDTKIVKEQIPGENWQTFFSLEDIQIGDSVGIKSDEINVEKKEASVTDILILNPAPSAAPKGIKF